MSSPTPKLVKVYNLTDVETPVLKQRNLIEQHVAIDNRMCEPGQYVEVTDSPSLRADVEFLVSVGALAVDQLPPPYVKARSAKEASKPGIAVGHLDVQETKVAADPSQAQAVVADEAALVPAEAAPTPSAKNRSR